MSDIFYFCNCEPPLDFKSEQQWRVHMKNYHGWTDDKFDAISKEIQNIDE